MHYNIYSFVRKLVTVNIMYIFFILYEVSNNPSPSVGTSSYYIVLYDFFIIVLKMNSPFFVYIYWLIGRFYYCMRFRGFLFFYFIEGYYFFLCLWIEIVTIGLNSNKLFNGFLSFFLSLFMSSEFSLSLSPPNKLWSIN